MLTEQYRLYRLDGRGMIHDAEWFEAHDDADAEAQIAAKHPNASCEIWRDKRLVANVGPPIRQSA